MVIGEQEYETARTLPVFAHGRLVKNMKVTFVTADAEDINDFPGIEAVREANLLLVSVRRRTPPTAQLDEIRKYVASGRPVVGIRTASHAFALRNGQSPPTGHDAWPEFDASVLGGNYQGHHGNKPDADEATFVWSALTGEHAQRWPMLIPNHTQTTSWLYKTSPLRPGASILMMGRVADRQPHEPVTWTYIHAGGGRTFYTSLGHPDEFATDSFQQLLKAGMHWALDHRENG
jgi:hypothetical protein